MTDLEEIKKRIDIVSLISEYVVLKKTGANFKGLCPFHSEKTPSFVVSSERQIWHCFGGCQDGGDIFRFLMRIENLEFSEAVKVLAKRAGVPLSQSYQSSQKSEQREKIWQINHLASEFYHYLLTTHPVAAAARKYANSRGLTDSSIKLFKIGYAPGSWDTLTKYLLKKGFSESDLIQAGLVGKSSIGNSFDKFRNRLMFTLFDHRGNVAGFSGRLMDSEAKEAKYINTAETPVYTKGDILFGLNTTKEEIKKVGFAVVVEGQIDTISSYQAGIRNVVAITGSALTAAQVQLLKRYTDTIALSLDSDFAGDAAAHRGIEIADQAGLNIKVVSFTQAKDPDELINKDPALWRQAVDTAVNFYDYVIDSAASKYDVQTAEGAKNLVTDVAKFIAPIDNLVVKNHYLRKLGDLLRMAEVNIDAQLAKEWKKNQMPGSAQKIAENTLTPEQKINRTRVEVLQDYLLALLLQSSKPADYLVLISNRLKHEDFTNVGLGKIYQLMLSLVENPQSDVTLPGPQFDIQHFAPLVPPELIQTVDRLYLTELPIDLSDDEIVLEEIQKMVWEIKELALKEQQKQLSAEIKKKGDDEELLKAFDQITLTLQKLRQDRALITS